MSPAAEQTNEQMKAAGAVSASTLERLGRIKAEGNPVLSVYLDLDPSRFPTPGARDAELSALLAGAGADELDVKHVREAVRTHPELAHGAHGLAIFSCAASGVLEALAVPEPVEPLVVVDSVPWLEPLAAMLASEDWGVAVLSRRDARLFRGGRDGLIEFAAVSDELHRRHAQGGWSQANLQRGIEQQVSEHARHAAELLLRAHRRRPFDHVVIVASDRLWPVIEKSLHQDLRDRLAGVVARDLEHASERDIARAVAPVIDGAELERERSLISAWSRRWERPDRRRRAWTRCSRRCRRDASRCFCSPTGRSCRQPARARAATACMPQPMAIAGSTARRSSRWTPSSTSPRRRRGSRSP